MFSLKKFSQTLKKAINTFIVMTKIPEKLFQILACPICKGNLTYNDDQTGLICKDCYVWYEIREGIPVLLKKKAKKC